MSTFKATINMFSLLKSKVCGNTISISDLSKDHHSPITLLPLFNPISSETNSPSSKIILSTVNSLSAIKLTFLVSMVQEKCKSIFPNKKYHSNIFTKLTKSHNLLIILTNWSANLQNGTNKENLTYWTLKAGQVSQV